MNDRYAGQLRGDRGDYARYLAGMDASMAQKVALTAAHLLGHGTVADMGMGSGTGSEALASLYPRLQVIGVDVSPQMVELARERYQRPNLRFELGDIATAVFPPNSLDGIFDSSVLHHVTSFGGYERQAAMRAIEVQVGQLRDHGVVIVRDFVEPELGSTRVLLDVPVDDGDDSDDPRTCSTAALLERFAREFRGLHPEPGFELERGGPADVMPPRAGRRRYALALRHSVEFVLRKDYRHDWESEVKEEYTYATQTEFEAAFARVGLRVLASTPIRNPWIVRHRFRDKFELRSLDGEELEDPATNYLIVGEKVPAGHGVRFVVGPEAMRLGFLQIDHYRDRSSGRVRDLVARPGLTVDALPWFEHDGDLFVLARMGYPRPILRAGETALDGSRAPDYITEPIAVIQGDAPVAQTIEDALEQRCGVSPSDIQRFADGATYYPSPGGLREEVRSVMVRIEPSFDEREIPRSGPWTTAGRVGAIEAQQLLRAAMVGGLPDARLEINVHLLLRRLGRPVGPWIGASVELPDRELPSGSSSVAQVRAIPPRRRFERVGQTRDPFLRVHCRRFEEIDAAGTVVGRQSFEYVEPAHVGARTIVAAVLRRVGAKIFIGVEDDDLPAAQCIGGNSNLLVAPGWRIPRALGTFGSAIDFVRNALHEAYGVQAAEVWELGGRYHPSAGATPEVVHPIAVDVFHSADVEHGLLWLDLEELLDCDDLLRDGHLRIVAFRAAHATGLLASR